MGGYVLSGISDRVGFGRERMKNTVRRIRAAYDGGYYEQKGSADDDRDAFRHGFDGNGSGDALDESLGIRRRL